MIYPNFLPCFLNVSEFDIPCCDRFGLAVNTLIDPRRIEVFFRFSSRLFRKIYAIKFMEEKKLFTVEVIDESLYLVLLHTNQSDLDENHEN